MLIFPSSRHPFRDVSLIFSPECLYPCSPPSFIFMFVFLSSSLPPPNASPPPHPNTCHPSPPRPKLNACLLLSYLLPEYLSSSLSFTPRILIFFSLLYSQNTYLLLSPLLPEYLSSSLSFTPRMLLFLSSPALLRMLLHFLSPPRLNGCLPVQFTPYPGYLSSFPPHYHQIACFCFLSTLSPECL
jgi:hypothetical protein